MKNSMKSRWQQHTLGEICEVVAGQSPKGSFYNKYGDGTPFYQGKKDFGDKYLTEPTVWTRQVTKIAKPDDILMSVRAPVGSINICNREICIGRGLASIRPSTLILKDFLYYFLLVNKATGSKGAVFDSINKNQIENIRILLPPLEEQKRIVSILDDIFKDAEKAKEVAEKNSYNVEKLKKSVLNKAFRGDL